MSSGLKIRYPAIVYGYLDKEVSIYTHHPYGDGDYYGPLAGYVPNYFDDETSEWDWPIVWKCDRS